jgi:hypothetical protein
LPVLRRVFLYLWVVFSLAAGEAPSDKAAPDPVVPGWRHGDFSLYPSGFLDVIGMTRSATTADSVSTHFGSIPLEPTSAETVASVAHSRVALHSGYGKDATARFSTYLEADFLNPVADAAPFRWRQYWASFRWSHWEVLGGKGWSLMRMNRAGLLSDRDMMNTDVVDPAYHTGLVGTRRRQVRLAWHGARNAAALTWENNGDFAGKWSADPKWGHFEAVGLSGHRGRRAAQVSALVKVHGGLSLIGQQYVARHALNEALGVVADGVSGFSTLEGCEWRINRHWEWYNYGGAVRSTHSSGNRWVGQYTSGVNWFWPSASMHGLVTLSLQYSYLDRATWDGRSGQMHFVMYRLRFTVP